jgi:hypothetical protein
MRLTSTHDPGKPPFETVLPGLQFRVASTIDEVIAAWHLVHQCYVRSGLIGGNAHALHTTPQAIRPDTTVIAGYDPEGNIATTLSVIPDGDDGAKPGLPLDEVYREELDTIRARDGAKLFEVGLLAGRRENLSRRFRALNQLMSLSIYLGLHGGLTDVLIGVHPHHEEFYERRWALQRVGVVKRYQTVNENLVVLMHVDLATMLASETKGGQWVAQHHPPAAAYFDLRFPLSPETIRGTGIDAFLASGRQGRATRPSVKSSRASA